MRRTITKANVRASGIRNAEEIVNRFIGPGKAHAIRHIRRAEAVLEAIIRENNAYLMNQPEPPR